MQSFDSQSVLALGKQALFSKSKAESVQIEVYQGHKITVILNSWKLVQSIIKQSPAGNY